MRVHTLIRHSHLAPASAVALLAATAGVQIGALHLLPLDAAALVLINQFIWLTAAGLASAACFYGAAACAERDGRLAWRLLAAACGTWTAGQAWWIADRLFFTDSRPSGFSQLLFLAFSPLMIAGILRLPKPAQHAARLSFKQVSNAILLLCCFVAILLIALREPALISKAPPMYVLASVLQCAAITSVFFVALYQLWGYRWRQTWRPLAIIAAGTAIYALSSVAYIHMLLVDGYSAAGWINASWTLSFGCIAFAAIEQRRQARNDETIDEARELLRERWLEAVMPALMILAAMAALGAYSRWLSPSTLNLYAGIAIVFAIVLGIRESHIQRQEQLLVRALRENNSQLQNLNQALLVSEERYRHLTELLDRRVTDRTAELQRAYQDLETFSYAVAHDLKAPLRSIEAFGALLTERAEGQLDDQGRDYLRRIRRASVNLGNLIDDLLAYAHVDRREWRIDVVELRGLVQEIVDEQRSEIARLSAQMSVNVVPISLKLSREGLASVLRNLLQNALKYSQHATPPRIEIDGYEWDGGVRLAVRDNGIGFDMNYHDQIFELFKRLHRSDEFKGTGIGLAIVRRAVERMHGRIWADSRPGKGATFFIDLPLDANEHPAATPAVAALTETDARLAPTNRQ